MYEVIKHYFSKWFGLSLTQKEALTLEFDILLNEVRDAKTLAQLFNVKSKILMYIADVQQLGNPTWGQKNINILSVQWNKKYNSWKKFRGFYGTNP
jgi:hypothetical protein